MTIVALGGGAVLLLGAVMLVSLLLVPLVPMTGATTSAATMTVIHNGLVTELAALAEPTTGAMIPTAYRVDLQRATVDNCPRALKVQPAMPDVLGAIWEEPMAFLGAASGQVDTALTVVQSARKGKTSTVGTAGPMQLAPSVVTSYEGRVSFGSYERSDPSLYDAILAVPSGERVWNLAWSFAIAAKLLCDAAKGFLPPTGKAEPSRFEQFQAWTKALVDYSGDPGYALGVLAQAMLWFDDVPVHLANVRSAMSSKTAPPTHAALELAIVELVTLDTALETMGLPMVPMCDAVPPPAIPASATSLTDGSAPSYVAMVLNMTAEDFYEATFGCRLENDRLVGAVTEAQLYETTARATATGNCSEWMPKVAVLPGDLVFLASVKAATSTGLATRVDDVGIALGPGSGTHKAAFAFISVPAGAPAHKQSGHNIVGVAWLTPTSGTATSTNLIGARYVDPFASRAATQTVVALTDPSELIAGARIRC
jgi:hypothetical protein